MKKYITRDREAGNVIDEFTTLEEAENALAEYEAEDKADGTYTEGFYEIAEINKLWYCVQAGEDNDWGDGSYRYAEAKAKAEEMTANPLYDGKQIRIVTVDEEGGGEAKAVEIIRDGTSF